MVGIWNWCDHRTVRVMVLIKVYPLTMLVGQEFVNAWLETVKCVVVYPVLLVPLFYCFVLQVTRFSETMALRTVIRFDVQHRTPVCCTW